MEVNARSSEYSRRLPPPEAWRQPDRFLDLKTGLPLEEHPVLDIIVDDRGFVKPDETIEVVMDELFWPDYEWTYNNRDPELRIDYHHFHHRSRNYDPDLFGGSDIPQRFRNIPTLMGPVFRPIHNTLHDYTPESPVPDFDAMADYVASYGLAHRAFSRLIKSASNVTHASHMFSMRQISLQSGLVYPEHPDDHVAREMMIDFFHKHFKEYGRAIDDVLLLDGTDFAMTEQEKALLTKPHLVARKVGHIASRDYVKLLPRLRAVRST